MLIMMAVVVIRTYEVVEVVANAWWLASLCWSVLVVQMVGCRHSRAGDEALVVVIRI